MSTGYGRDTHCYDEIITGRIVSGFELLAQAIFRRLTTPRGTLRYGEDASVYGLDVLDFVGMVGTQNAVDAIPDAIVAEVLKDDRIARCECKATLVHGTDGLDYIELDIDAHPADGNEDFTLSLSVSDVSASLVGVTPL